MYFTPSNNNNSTHLRLLASLWTRILTHHKGKGFPSYLFAKGTHWNVTLGFAFFCYHCGITVFSTIPVRASIRYTLLLNIITAAKSSIQKTGNARIQVWLPACIHYDTNFIIKISLWVLWIFYAQNCIPWTWLRHAERTPGDACVSPWPTTGSGTNLAVLSMCECPPRTTTRGTSANKTPEYQTEYSKYYWKPFGKAII